MEKFQVINPADETVVTSVELTSLEETDRAINRAHAAFPKWRAIPPGERAELLRNFARNVEAHKLELADLEIKNSGHTRGNALWEVGNVVNTLNYYSAAPERLFGKQIPVPNGVDITFKEPLGVVGIIVPWNFPMPIAGWGFAPALAAGNTVVLKPAEYTPLTAMKLAEIAQKSGIPADVFQVLPGKGSVVGNRFVTHPLVRKIVFTGSTSVGQQIMSGCADQIKRVTLELGGKNANIILPMPILSGLPLRHLMQYLIMPVRIVARALASWYKNLYSITLWRILKEQLKQFVLKIQIWRALRWGPLSRRNN